MIKIPRISRKNINTPFLHTMVQGINKEFIFNKNQYIEFYINLIKKYSKEYEIVLIAYCIMNNHAHLILYVEDIKKLGKFMHRINLIYSHFYNKENGRCGVIFRNRYKTEQIYNFKYLINCIRYIHLNPVKAKIVDSCEQYKYSSCKEYLNNGAITKSKIMIELFGRECDFSKILNYEPKYKFIDIEDLDYEEIKYLMDFYINDFIRVNHLKLEEILSDVNKLKMIINYLKDNGNFKNTEIMKKFEISKTMFYKII